MNYDPSEVKKLREQHALLQAKCAELQREVARLRKALEDVRDEAVISVGKSETVQWKMLAMARANIAIEALELIPVQTESEGPMDNGIRAILPKDCELCSKPLHWCSRCGELQTACGWTLCDECRYLDDPRMSPVQLSPTPTQSEDKK